MHFDIDSKVDIRGVDIMDWDFVFLSELAIDIDTDSH